MISVVLYGRNDAHGYNLHKRGAISLNCMAEVLTAPDDEIIFVDYNTPDDFPTFPEAIADTLTARAQQLLRILRVRPRQHQRFKDRTRLAALEPIARNVAVRRSRPENRWILSTNTDVILVPRRERSLSAIADGLADAYYHLPRFELPESLWETFDRSQPAEVIARLRDWGPRFHLEEIALLQYPETKYDAPGDFQLMLRADLWRVHGFDEQMLLGWHVDSNVAKRLALLPRPRGEVVDELFGYHCDHYRQLTALHALHGQRNDVQSFFLDVTEADLPAQADTWGLAGETVEELTLGAGDRRYVAALDATLPLPSPAPTQFQWTGKADEEYDYSVDHVLPFLESSVAAYPRDTNVAWAGAEKPMLWRFAAAWKIMGFTQPIGVDDRAPWLGPALPPSCRWEKRQTLDERSDLLIFDFGRQAQRPGIDPRVAREHRQAVVDAFQTAVAFETRRLEGASPLARRFIGVNPFVSGEVAQIFEGSISMPFIPNGTHIKEGVVSEATRQFFEAREVGCLPLLLFGNAATWGAAPYQPQKQAIHARPGVSGILAYGPYLSLSPGRYEAVFEFYAEPSRKNAGFAVDVAANRGKRVLAHREIKPHAGIKRYHEALRSQVGPVTCILPFEVGGSRRDEDGIEFRIWSPGTINFCLVDLRVRQVATLDATDAVVSLAP